MPDDAVRNGGRPSRLSDSHPYCRQPTDRDSRVWRYMDFAKFVVTLQGGLYLARADTLGDPWEGALPARTTRVVRAVEEEFRESGQIDDMMGLLLDSNRKLLMNARLYCYANCWHMLAHEVAWMWSTYCSGPFGVAIRSTYDRLDRALPLTILRDTPVMLSLVKYGDYSSDDFFAEPTCDYDILLSKRLAFADEREVRILIYENGLRDHPLGIAIPIDMSVIAEAVVVSPMAPSWFASTVSALCAKYELTVKIEQSALAALPPQLDAPA